MALPYRHERVAADLHRFVFPSESRPGIEHELLLDLSATGPERLSCTCEASLFGKMCKHKRLVIQRQLGRPRAWRAARRWRRMPPRAGRRRRAAGKGRR